MSPADAFRINPALAHARRRRRRVLSHRRIHPAAPPARGLSQGRGAVRRAGRVGRRGDGLRHAAGRHHLGGADRGRPDRRGRRGECRGTVGGIRGRMGGRGIAGHAAPPAGRRHRAVRSPPRDHADDDLRRGRLPPPGARRSGAAAVAHAGSRRPAVRRQRGSGVGAAGDRNGACAGAGAAAGRGGPCGVLGRTVRDVPRQARHSRRCPRVSQSLPDQRLLGSRRHARARAGAPARRDHVGGAGHLPRRVQRSGPRRFAEGEPNAVSGLL